ncbi:MAG TPA: DUF3823 domain-containing protein [Mucilaginibacter sp.]|nr:DUF3823 domain-containing protein [Mucilaginibacter sp.]
MKKLMSRVLLGVCMLASAACTKIDNYGGPNASFQGRLIDATTHANFETSQNSIQVQLEQISWSATPTPQFIPSKSDGTFEDTKLFKGTYRIIPKGGAFWPVYDSVKMEITQGSSHDFELTPYVVIKNLTHELVGTTLTLKYDIDAPVVAGLPTIIDTQPYVNTTKLVGAGASIRDYSETRAVAINKEFIDLTPGEKSITLTIPNLISGRKFFARVGVRLNDSFKSSNFSEVIEIDVP